MGVSEVRARVKKERIKKERRKRRSERIILFWETLMRCCFPCSSFCSSCGEVQARCIQSVRAWVWVRVASSTVDSTRVKVWDWYECMCSCFFFLLFDFVGVLVCLCMHACMCVWVCWVFVCLFVCLIGLNSVQPDISSSLDPVFTLTLPVLLCPDCEGRKGDEKKSGLACSQSTMVELKGNVV